MKKKGKGRFSKILCTLLVCIFGVLGVGCSGNDSNYSSTLKDRYENGEISYDDYLEQRLLSQSVPLYGTKVLYRPESYGWEDEDYIGEGNEYYYGQYAWWILDELVRTYTFAEKVQNNDPPIETIVPDSTDNDKLNGFYDSVRYQISSYGNNISQEVKITKNADGSTTKGSPSQTGTSYVVRASTQKAWNWNFGTNVENYQYSYYVYDEENKPAEEPTIESISVIAPAFNSDFTNRQEVYDEFSFIYNNGDYQNNYSKVYLGTQFSSDETHKHQLEFLNYSEYVKALEYAIYCFNLDLTPNSMEVHLKSDGTPSVEIAGYPAADGKSSVDIALETIQEVFKKVGSYVGITNRQQIRLKNWILQNIIGENSDNSFTINEVTTTSTQFYYEDTNGQRVNCDEYGNPQTTPQPKVETSSPVKVADIDRHYEENIDAIIDICTTLVSIGQKPEDEGEENNVPTISDKYLASEVIDYFGNDFFISADKGNEFANIPELEYQSFALMFRKKFQFSNIRLMFNYKGSDDIAGNESITINIHMNHYTKEDNLYRPAYLKQGSNKYEVMQITIRDTGFSYGSRNNTAMLYGINSNDKNGKGWGITCSEFNTGIGNGILQSIEEYNGLVSIGTALPLTGNNDRRNYYTMQNGFNEEDKTTYTYGTLNPEKFSGSDGCDFFEVAFEVVKVTTAADYATKNYKFQVGLAVVA